MTNFRFGIGDKVKLKDDYRIFMVVDVDRNNNYVVACREYNGRVLEKVCKVDHMIEFKKAK